MARAIETIDLTEVLHYEETIGGVVVTVKYLPLRKDSDGVLLIRDLVVEPEQIINKTKNSTYIDSAMDTYLNNAENGYLSRFDTKMQDCIIPTAIKLKPDGADEVTEIARQIFLLSETEVGGNNTLGEGENMLSAFETHRNTADADTARIACNTAGTACRWWLRSAASSTYLCCVAAGGYFSSNVSSYRNFARPAFKVRNGTMVSDQGEDTIYIFPDEAHLYRELEFVTYLGGSQNRPKKAKVQVDISNATESSIKISNNAKDTSPAWVECTNGSVAEMTNTAKETDNWELGVKIYAKSGGRAIVGEPVLMVETDGLEVAQ